MTGQPMPTGNNGPVIHHLVQADLEERLQVGIGTYGQPLQPHNGRDALQDAYEEALDLACYLRQALVERDGPPKPEPLEPAVLAERFQVIDKTGEYPTSDPTPEPGSGIMVKVRYYDQDPPGEDGAAVTRKYAAAFRVDELARERDGVPRAIQALADHLGRTIQYAELIPLETFDALTTPAPSWFHASWLWVTVAPSRSARPHPVPADRQEYDLGVVARGGLYPTVPADEPTG